jgi:sporulation protein YlmC with PRC-barrel domain
MPETQTRELVGREVLSVRGERIGKIDELLVHGDGDEPNWARVKIGMLGLRSALIPLYDAQDEEDAIRIVYEKDHVKDAPSVEPRDDRLSDDDADLLHRYYGLERVTGLTAPGADDDIELSRETRDATPPGLKEGPDSPLTKRRRKRARELGVHEHR